MYTLLLIGFLGGLITGISPCILPVLPVIFFSGAQSARVTESDGATIVASKPTMAETLRPYRVIAGLVLSFSVVTLAGSALLQLLHLPQDALRWAGLLALTLIGLGLIFPRFEQMLEKPFSRIPQKQFASGSSGFGLGLALGVLYVPCAGPVLAAIVVAGATGSIGANTVALTLSFAVGAALPLLVFALAGRRVAERVNAFRRQQRKIRLIGGIVMLVFALALAANVPAKLQRAIPDYTSGLQDRVATAGEVQDRLSPTGSGELSKCIEGAEELQNCGAAPDITGIAGWLNTPEGAPVDLKSLRGRVVLVDFWAYSCINCQRAIPHVVDWYGRYKDSGLTVIGVHTPEYAFERVPGNVAKGAADLGITYPVALDNSYSTWTNFENRYWPAEYLIDANGVVRHVKFGEGGYDTTERLIRELLTDAKNTSLPAPVNAPDVTPTTALTPETYLGVGKEINYAGGGTYDEGDAAFDYPKNLPADSFALQGPWHLDYQGATANGAGSAIKLDYQARNVYLVVGGTGTVTVLRGGETTTVPVSGPPTLRQIVSDRDVQRGEIEVRLSQGLQAFSFTYG
ncbi:cytochrome c biogenesis protein DipZ [Mycolicibacterium neworleansense]|uniref:Cytochrome C biogenesis protein DipZ n=1 Tax=Mycolicibacterium neworleansense TaxID=146018 RepID=A0A0H5RRJ5_9MYCO|nr:cytochrome c biogenesis protein DipZ [Mycolicibacterium neworleansense]MCV7365313.1 cytochrome c biogenesis protein DipZ [Mycolicibacterium neworleansense]CRZ16117.1 cytochrome C biogenesis protein DipZ [Mycolicibacterium neworleansense]